MKRILVLFLLACGCAARAQAPPTGTSQQFDKNGDGKVTREETGNAGWFDSLDLNRAGYVVRHADGRYGTGQIFDPAVVPSAQGGLRSARTVCVSPFPEDQGRVLYFGGFDAAQGPHRDTAWISRGALPNRATTP